MVVMVVMGSMEMIMVMTIMMMIDDDSYNARSALSE